MKTVPQSQSQQQQLKSNINKNKNNNPPIYITEKQGKRFLVINPSSPAFVEGFADIDHQYAGFKLPLNNNNLLSGYPPLPLQQQPNIDGGNQEFGTPGIFPAAVQGPWSSMKISGMPILRGQSFGGVFRGYMAVPVLSRLPVNGFSQPLYQPQSQSPQQGFLYNNLYQQAPSYIQETPRVVEQYPRYPFYHQRIDRYFNNLQPSPYLTQPHPYYPRMTPTTQEYDNNRVSSNYYPHQEQQVLQSHSLFGLQDYHYIHDEPREARRHSFFHYRGEAGYQAPLAQVPQEQVPQEQVPQEQEQVPQEQLPPHNFYRDQPSEQEEPFQQTSQSRDIFEQQREPEDHGRFAGNTVNSEEELLSAAPAMPSPVSAKPFQFEDIHESEVEANRGSMFSSYFNNGPASSQQGPFGVQNHFMEKSNIDNQQQQGSFEMDNQMVKRSRQQFQQSQQQHHQGPYVFTKDHVGFGPITVEAHTASYKGSDPKDDDK